MFILDATQRYYVLQELEKQGYTIPEIPYIEIEAKNKKDAAQKLLQITSRYGKINSETSFFDNFDIELDYINEIEIPEFDISFGHDQRFKKGKGNIAQDVSFIKSEEEALKVHDPELFENVEDILISFSGGKDSTFALLWAKTNFPDKHITAFFANTNVEFPGMAAHVVDCCKFLDVEYKIIYPKDDMWLKIEEKGCAFDISRDIIDTVLEKSEIPIWDGYNMGFVRTACWMCPQQCGEQAYALQVITLI